MLGAWTRAGLYYEPRRWYLITHNGIARKLQNDSLKMIFSCDLDMQTYPRFFPVYVTTKQKTDICDNFQVIMHTYTHTLPNNNNNNNQDSVYGAVIMAEPLREFTQFI